MAKITSKATLVKGTNYKYHLVDVQGTDIEIDITGSQIISTSTDFTASSETAGVVKRAIQVGDVLTLSNTTNASNEGLQVTVATVAALLITFTSPTGSPVDEAAGAAINITATLKQYQFLAASGLSFVDGVEGIVWASKTVDDWDATDLDIYPRIFTSIEPRAKSIAALNGWEPFDNDTLKAQRDTALEIRPDANTTATKVYALLRSGNLNEATDQFYIWYSGDTDATAPQQAVTAGYVNEVFLIVDTGAALDERGTWNYRCLENGKTHLQATLNLQYAEIYPVANNNGIDPKLADPGTGTPLVSDGTIAAGGIYANILLNIDVDSTQPHVVDSVSRDFFGNVDQDSQTNQTLHTKIHYLLRQSTNVNSDGTGPTLRGDKSPPISSFSGDLLTMDQYFPVNYNDAERNNLQVIDLLDITRSWPKIYTLTITGPALAVGGTFSLIHKDTYGASGAVYLEDETPTAQSDITIASSVSIVVPYSTYNVDSHPANTPIPLVLTWNRPGFIEPDYNDTVVMGAANQTVAITPAADPSYTAA